MSQKIGVAELREHPKNHFFFDDMSGDAWGEFVESVKTSGVIEPIVVTQDNVIVSGHQRVRACKTLGIKEIEAEVRDIESEDEVLKQLIETNIRQRGVGNTNPVKFGRCLMELERIYGIQQGKRTDLETFPHNAEKSQEDLASELGMSVDSLNRYKQLAKAIPEIQSLVESGKVTKTVALGIMKRLSEDEQKQLAEMLPKEKGKVSSFEIKFYENRIKDLNQKNEDLKSQIVEMEQHERDLQDQIADMEGSHQEPDIREVEVEVVPDDYEDLKSKNASYTKENKMLLDGKRRQDAEIKQLRERLADLETRQDVTELQKKLKEEAGHFAIRTYDYIQKNGGYVWVTERMKDLQGDSRRQFISAVYAIDAFAKQMVENIGGYGLE